MVLADFLTETRRKWLKAIKLLKRSKCRPGGRNRVSPALVRAPSYSGTVDACADIDLRRFCCRASVPPLLDTNTSDIYHKSPSPYSSTCSSYGGSRHESIGCISDSAYDSAASATSSPFYATSSPGHATSSPGYATSGYATSSPSSPRAVCYATVAYFNVNDSEDSSSIHTEYTLLDADGAMDVEEDELAQNMINESIELVSTL